MRLILESIKRYPIALLIGAIFGLLASPISVQITDAVFRPFDRAFPVVEMQGVIISRSGDAVDIHMSGTKNRECTYVQLLPYAVRGDRMHDLSIQRLDSIVKGDTKPLGNFDIGVWRVWPVGGASAVVIMVQHICAGRIVTTKIAEVKL